MVRCDLDGLTTKWVIDWLDYWDFSLVPRATRSWLQASSSEVSMRDYLIHNLPTQDTLQLYDKQYRKEMVSMLSKLMSHTVLWEQWIHWGAWPPFRGAPNKLEVGLLEISCSSTKANVELFMGEDNPWNPSEAAGQDRTCGSSRNEAKPPEVVASTYITSSD